MPMRHRAGVHAAALLVAAVLAPGAARCSEADTKRTEGRYFVEMSEIFLSAEQFDLAIVRNDPDGPRGPLPAEEVASDLSSMQPIAPRITIGLNRPGNKTAISLTALDFELDDRLVPETFENDEALVISRLMPPGVVFQRQAAPPGQEGQNSDEFVPNWGTVFGFIRKADFKMGDFTVERNIWESGNQRFRIRWMGGLRYAQLEQGIEHATSFAAETAPPPFEIGQAREVRDLFLLRASTSTRGFGPKFGIATRWLLGENKRWSIEAKGDVAIIPESSVAWYEARFVDSTPEVIFSRVEDPEGGITVRIEQRSEGPILPGIGAVSTALDTRVEHTDYTDTTFLFTGNLGFRYRPRRYFSVGLDLWQLRWHGLLSSVGVIDTAHQSGRYEIFPGEPDAPDPQLRDTETVLHVPRFERRDDFVFNGIALNLRFDF